MKHIIDSKQYCNGFKVHTLDITMQRVNKPAELISSKTGAELQSDIDAAREIVARQNVKAAQNG